MNATQILEYLNIHSGLNINRVMVGKAMPACGFERVKDHKTDRYGYHCRKMTIMSTPRTPRLENKFLCPTFILPVPYR